MYLVYSLLYTLGFLLMLPHFILRREKYSAGFRQRLGNYPEFKHDGRPVVWLHCVSVGETNAARTLVDGLLQTYSDHRVVISTTTKTGQELAQNIFREKADAVFYFPFDWKFSVSRALDNFRPSVVLLMETEIWPRFIREAHLTGAKVAIVNGRLSERSARRYSRVRSFVAMVLENVSLALMQDENDAERIKRLGIEQDKVSVTGNLKFEQKPDPGEGELTEIFRNRFGINGEKRLIIAASTHEPEERYIIEALDGLLSYSCRLLIAPRHPGRFDHVARLLRESPYRFVRRTDPPSEKDIQADIILLDSIGELRAAYPLAEIVFVGGSLIPHGGQSILEPAAFGKAIVTGPYTSNFDAVVGEFLENEALLQTPKSREDYEVTERLYEMFTLLEDDEKRCELGRNAAAVMGKTNREATVKTIEKLSRLISPSDKLKTEN